MVDHNFFKRSAPLKLSDIAAITGAEIGPGASPDIQIEDVAALDVAGPKDLSFLDNAKYRDDFKKTKAGACFVRPEMLDLAPKGLALLVSDSPYKSYALAAQEFYPAERPEARIAPQAIIDESAEIGEGCIIEEGAVIRAGAKIGDHSWIAANAYIGPQTVLGAYCRVGVGASITHALIGDHVNIYPGARIGQDGFGFAIDPKGFVKVPQLGRVIIEDHVEIGANSTIDRGSGPDTIIGQGTWIDNLVQIGHNVKIGKGCVLVAQTGISGSTIIEDYAMFGGQSGVAGHLRIGKGARVAAQAGIIHDIPPGEDRMGFPGLPSRQYLRQIATLNRLIKKDK